MIRNRWHRRHVRSAASSREYVPRIARFPARGAATIKPAHEPAIAALEYDIPGTPPSSSVSCTELADCLRDKAMMYRKLAEQADHPVVKNEMLELASSIGRLACNWPWIPNVHNGKDDVVARAVRRKAAQLVRW